MCLYSQSQLVLYLISGVNLEISTLIFTGGTSARFANQIAKVFKVCKFTQNPLYASVIGMYMRTNKIYEDMLKNAVKTEEVSA